MISVITPVLNEEEYVTPFLAHLGRLKGPFEVILVDGGSTDGTLAEATACLAESDRRATLLETDRGRANQMNAGAGKASGEVLLFLHVDCFVPEDSLIEIDRVMLDEGIVGGGFLHAFSDPDLLLRATSSLGNMLARLNSTFFGDSGIFIRRDLFLSMGGYDPLPFLEDVELCRKAKRYGRLVQIGRAIESSPRRYASKGRFRLTLVFVLALLLNLLGIRPGFLVRYIVDR
ncbi:MAG: TIGR04283 family arsenosugar biosynthesis glycosyltransferase [Methanomicrobiaceae archaeon]|uniref:Glycosyl transferase, family 2 n=1 Tax=hydrocarbon metagenome TaxID=938273 RepID=A0A0W8FI92_9ZZZZ|nr:TIGR04283 family arsenosugar biosynthesis glycosyltransferase [Methanomicrobiaceae archaeon]MDD5418554.1 TIGR04283 family arsenosugar biosynthesis glycosyltransferase [Methanomicrobiaceae archaeon]